MVAVPAEAPVMAPVPAFIDATPLLLLVHVPPVVASLSIPLLQMVVLPVIDAGKATIVIGELAEHPADVV